MAACRGGCSISSSGGASPGSSLKFEVVRNGVARGGRLSADSREAVCLPIIRGAGVVSGAEGDRLGPQMRGYWRLLS